MSSNDELRTGEVAALLRVDRSTVYRLPKDKLTYRWTPGGQRRYQRSDVVAYGRNVMNLTISDNGGESGVPTA